MGKEREKGHLLEQRPGSQRMESRHLLEQMPGSQQRENGHLLEQRPGGQQNESGEGSMYGKKGLNANREGVKGHGTSAGGPYWE